MKLLDLFSGAGGAAMGYHQAGFTDITGVDHKPQPRYPFQFVQDDALEHLAEHGREYDVIHASPPCQAYSSLRYMNPTREHPDLIQATRDLLVATGKIYVIENVPGAALLEPFLLCGVMFGLRVFRHRLFESNVFMLTPWHPPHRAFGKAAPLGRPACNERRYLTVTGSFSGVEYAKAAMGIDWMTQRELSQAIPPAYTRYIGAQMRRIAMFSPACLGEERPLTLFDLSACLACASRQADEAGAFDY